VIDRQKLIGWIIVMAGAGYVVYFLKIRLIEPGPALQTKEWTQFFVSIVLIMIGTANVRLAAMRARRRRGLPK
jgi:hypothetical protein